MPNYNFDPTSTTASIEVLPKGDYEVIIGEGKPFLRDGEKGQNWGIMFPLIVADGIHKDKKVYSNSYMHTPGAGTFTKQFQMAVLGFERNQSSEEQFNEEYGKADWSFDPESGHLGEGWKELFGKRVIVSLDTQPHRDRPDEMTQQFKGFRPVSAVSTL
jgi:hypothetical protein